MATTIEKLDNNKVEVTRDGSSYTLDGQMFIFLRDDRVEVRNAYNQSFVVNFSYPEVTQVIYDSTTVPITSVQQLYDELKENFF